MTMLCMPDIGDKYTTSYAYPGYHDCKMDKYAREHTRSPSQPAIPIATVMTANENWRGKNDPAERRRIQNRLNQRAFRQRQRAGESPKQYKPRSMSSASQQDSDDEADSPDSGAGSTSVEGRAASETAGESSSSATNTQPGRVWDELAQLINRNFMAATVTNANHVGVELNALQTGTSVRTPRVTDRQIPASLTPIDAQHQLPHDPIIDIIPHARLRYNILRATASGQLDSTDFTKCLRASGSLELLNGSWQRGGVVVWSFPEQVASWELSEPFLRRWAFLLEGCEDLIAATNCWRSKRGEKLFPQSINRSAVMVS